MPTNLANCYFNECSSNIVYKLPKSIGLDTGYQYPRTGKGTIILFYINGPPYSDLRHYYQVKLLDSLKKGKNYLVTKYVNNYNGSFYGCNNIGMLLTKTVVSVDTNTRAYGILPANPQILNYGNPIIWDTLNWVKVSGIYKAKGGEQYLTLGNFNYDTQTLYKQFQPNGYPGAAYNIDDVSVIPLDSMCLKADAGKDTTITIGDSIFIGSYTNGIDSLRWLQATTVIDSIRPGFWVKPTAGTSYILQQTVNGCFSSDTVTITVNPLPLKFVSFAAQIQPTPSPSKEGNVLLQWQTVNEINVSHFNIQRSVNGVAFTTIGKVVAQNKSVNSYEFTDVHLPSLEGLGVGFYRIQAIDKDGKISYSETKNVSINNKNRICIFPNPCKDFINVTGNNIQQIVLSSTEGKKILSTVSKKIDISKLSNGIYFISIKTNNNYVTQKFIKY